MKYRKKCKGLERFERLEGLEKCDGYVSCLTRSVCTAFTQFIIFCAVIFIGLGLLFKLRGDKIQKVVSDKSRISDVRAATLIDFSYALILFYKLFISTVPMSTTWVFLGLIGGREIAINLARIKKGKKHKNKAIKMIGKDLLYATIGLVISLLLAASVNDAIKNDLILFVKDLF